ncbi:MAG: hypothetical protein VR65_24395 [Desulfobulbaceae bacterium BRH_c16a]|nr:MAG: hypothetical protein VR65_24395 [Desulfobulbaceae bacterium BRH_c16a]
MRSRFVFLFIALSLAGCTVGPDYQRPDLSLPDSYRNAVASPALQAIAGLPWWQVFADPTLKDLIATALVGNLDVKLAAARVQEAKALFAGARSPALPLVSAGLYSSPAARQPGDDFTTSFLGGLFLSWEIDFWGRYARATEAARAQLLATQAAQDGVYASLVATVAQGYFQLQSLSETLRITRRTIDAQRESHRLVSRLADAGVSSAAEVRQAENQLATTESRLPGLLVQIARAENSLSVLLGRLPGPVVQGVPTEPVIVPEVPAGLPSELLDRRPDMRQAEQQLILANARVGEAKALFFPSISLTGTFGALSTELGDLVNGDAPSVVSPGLDLLQPLFAGGSLIANYDAALARLKQAGLAYRQTGLNALREVADALSQYSHSAEEIAAQRRREFSAREGLRLTEKRYRAGVVSYLEVLDAQRQLYSAETDLAQSKLTRRTAAVQLYLALGGGWVEVR